MQKNYIVNNFTLDEHQMNLLNCNSNAIVIAAAGSGKTLTIIGKVNFLIEHENILAEQILLISFTNSSVNDIKSKLKYDVDVFTFHKLANNILKANQLEYHYSENSLLKYIIKEYLFRCDNKEKKDILTYLKLNTSYSYFLKSRYYHHFVELIENFINLYKTNNYTSKDIQKFYFSKKEKKILLIIFKIYQVYLIEKKSRNLLDFDDIILLATKSVNNAQLNYKYIIIDEFQDCSQIRLALITKISQYTNSKIIVVGDDWQSIYKFSGCDLNLFLNFPNNFKNVKTIKLINTYRNSQELINIASSFIEKNPYQIKKNLISQKNNKIPIIFVPYLSQKNALKQVLDLLIRENKEILIISRNNNDILDYIDNTFEYHPPYLYYKNTTIKFLTIHKSKGLEADYVIILNCINNTFGFPNKIQNDKIINKLFLSEKIPYAEERRLFYVALTRCKIRTFILYNKNSPSIFVKELKKITKKQLKRINYLN